MFIVAIILSIIFLSFYLGHAIWIFKDSKKRQDDLAVFWCILSLISFPIVLIIYVILTRSNNESYSCSSCGYKVKNNWKFCPNCNQELKNNLNKENYENMNKEISIRKPIVVLPIVIFISGIVLFAAFFTFSILNIKNSFTKVLVPGTTIINLKHEGDYTIFYEYNKDEDATQNYSKLKDMNIILTNINSKGNVLINKSSSSSKYSFNGTDGRAFLKFHADEAGDYELSANSKASTNSKIKISITQGFVTKIVLTVLGSLIIIFGTILSGTLYTFKFYSVNTLTKKS
jgi:hypothetical protein